MKIVDALNVECIWYPIHIYLLTFQKKTFITTYTLHLTISMEMEIQ